MPPHTHRPATVLLTALAPAAWGTTYVVTTELLPPGHPMSAGLLRAPPAGLLGLALTRVLPRGDRWWRAAVLGALNIGGMPPAVRGGRTAPRRGRGHPGRHPAAAGRRPGRRGAARPADPVALDLGACSAWPASPSSSWARRPVWTRSASSPASAILATMAGGVVLIKRWGRPAGVGPLALAGWQLTVGGLLLLRRPWRSRACRSGSTRAPWAATCGSAAWAG
ncbi:hypothetical protein LT493_36435 [Streptomyces tricolor]|nr:hypothetical protein [Streptomyces tricolor]